jgi:hypothetical protein
MKPITRIDFIAPRRTSPFALALLLLATVALAWQAWLVWQGQRAVQHQRAALAVSARQAVVPSSSPSPQQRRMHVRLEQLAWHLAAPWDELLDLFERHGTGEVALVRLEPDAASGVVNLLARARDRHAMMVYVVSLESDPRLTSVLLRQHEVLVGADGAPVQFSVSAVWRPGQAQRARPALQEIAP